MEWVYSMLACNCMYRSISSLYLSSLPKCCCLPNECVPHSTSPHTLSELQVNSPQQGMNTCLNILLLLHSPDLLLLHIEILSVDLYTTYPVQMSRHINSVRVMVVIHSGFKSTNIGDVDVERGTVLLRSSRYSSPPLQ